jgi:hypothetical protein
MEAVRDQIAADLSRHIQSAVADAVRKRAMVSESAT